MGELNTLLYVKCLGYQVTLHYCLSSLSRVQILLSSPKPNPSAYLPAVLNSMGNQKLTFAENFPANLPLGLLCLQSGEPMSGESC